MAVRNESVALMNQQNEQIAKRIKQMIWLYFFLLIFEGALRKWFLPFLATPLLVVREPVAIYAVFLAIKYRLFPVSPSLLLFVLTGIVTTFLALFLGHQNLFVALFGARIFFFHVPFVYLIASFWTYNDFLQLGKIFLWLTLLMTIIIFFQFYSPQSALINRGVGGDTSGAGFSGAKGFFRPPGTFSFINGTTSFYALAICFITYFWLSRNKVNKILLIGATLGAIIAIPLSISRTYFFNVVLLLLFVGGIQLRNPRQLPKTLIAIVVLVLVGVVLVQVPEVSTALEAFTSRFDAANENEGGLEGVLLVRFLGGMYEYLFQAGDIPFWGAGLGMGANVGAMLLSGEAVFLLPEVEWGRILGEIGVVFGLLVIILRVQIGFGSLWKAFKKIGKGEYLSWLLLSTGFVVIIQGQWGQPTNLGFFVITTGLVLASLEVENSLDE